MKLEFDRTEHKIGVEDIKKGVWYLGRHKKTNKKGLILRTGDNTFYRFVDNIIEEQNINEVNHKYDVFELSTNAITIKIDKNKIL